MQEVFKNLFIEFEQVRADREAGGFAKYGDWTWLNVDTLQMAMEEVVDLANYARYTYVRLRLLQAALAELQAKPFPRDGFIPHSELWRPNDV